MGFPGSDRWVELEKVVMIHGGERQIRPTVDELLSACGGVIMFQMPPKNEWHPDSELNGKWIVAPNTEFGSNYLCASDSFIDTSFSESAVGDTPREALGIFWLEREKVRHPEKLKDIEDAINTDQHEKLRRLGDPDRS